MRFIEYLIEQRAKKENTPQVNPEDSAKLLSLVGKAVGLDEVKSRAKDYIEHLAYKKHIDDDLRILDRLSTVQKVQTFAYNIQLNGEGRGVIK